MTGPILMLCGYLLVAALVTVLPITVLLSIMVGILFTGAVGVVLWMCGKLLVEILREGHG